MAAWSSGRAPERTMGASTRVGRCGFNSRRRRQSQVLGASVTEREHYEKMARMFELLADKIGNNCFLSRSNCLTLAKKIHDVIDSSQHLYWRHKNGEEEEL